VPSPLRRNVEKRSAAPLTWLATRPRWLPFLIVLALLLGGLLAPTPIAAVLLVALALMLVWLTFLAWPKLDPTGRFSRLLVLVLVLYVLVQRLVG
jgi:hypothetical protein